MKIKKIILEAEPGDNIASISHSAVVISKENSKCAIEFCFNGVNVAYDGTTEEDRLQEQYRAKLNTPACMPRPKK